MNENTRNWTFEYFPIVYSTQPTMQCGADILPLLQICLVTFWQNHFGQPVEKNRNVLILPKVVDKHLVCDVFKK